MEVILENITTKFKRYYPKVNVISSDFINIEIELDVADLTDGEYQLTLYDDNRKIIGKELVKIGDYNSTKTQYKVEKKYTQYVRK